MRFFAQAKQTYGLIERWMDRQTYRQTIFIGCEDTSKKHLGQNLNCLSISRLETKISQTTGDQDFRGQFFFLTGRLLLLLGPLELGSTVFDWIEDYQNS